MFDLGTGSTAEQRVSSDRRTTASGRRTSVVVAAAAGLVLSSCGAGSDAPGATATVPHGGPSASQTQQPAAEDGTAAPQVTFEMFDGTTGSLSDHYGDRPLIVNFWASWCPPCVTEMPDIEQVHQHLGEQVNFLGINTQDGEQDARRLVDETGVTYPLAWDRQGEIFQAFGVFGMPSTFYISSEGQIVGRHTGLLTREALEEQIDQLLLDGAS